MNDYTKRGRQAIAPGSAEAYNELEMTATLVRRILYGGMATWVFVLAVEEFRAGGHTGAGIGLAVGGIVLAVLAIAGKGG